MIYLFFFDSAGFCFFAINWDLSSCRSYLEPRVQFIIYSVHRIRGLVIHRREPDWAGGKNIFLGEALSGLRTHGCNLALISRRSSLVRYFMHTLSASTRCYLLFQFPARL